MRKSLIKFLSMFSMSEDAASCEPGGAQGNYIMHRNAVSGESPNNDKVLILRSFHFTLLVFALFEASYCNKTSRVWRSVLYSAAKQYLWEFSG